MAQGKFSNWEGGVRSPAFISGPLVPPAARGSWFNGIFSACDWSATALDLAGLSLTAMAARPGATELHHNTAFCPVPLAFIERIDESLGLGAVHAQVMGACRVMMEYPCGML